MLAQPPLVFIIYAREDEQFRAELKAQLLPMERAKLLRVWTDRELIAGEHWEPIIKKNLASADVILLLVSSDYFQSDYIHEFELREAIERHQRGEARVIPVIVRPCDWEPDPVVSSLQVLPTDGVPVNDTRHWHTREAAWVDVVRGVRRTLQQLQEERAALAAADEAAAQAEIARRTVEEQQAREAETRERAAQAAEVQRKKEEAARRIAEEQQTREAEARERAARKAEAQRRQAETARRTADHAAWQQAQQVNTPSAYQAYLVGYPDGEYVYDARRRIKQMQNNGSGNRAWRKYILAGGVVVLVFVSFLFGPKLIRRLNGGYSPEQIAKDWTAAQDTNTIPAYRRFLEKHQDHVEAEKALKAHRQKFDHLIEEAITLLGDTMYLNASNQVKNARMLWPDHPLLTDARDFIETGRYEEAKQTLRRALKSTH